MHTASGSWAGCLRLSVGWLALLAVAGFVVAEDAPPTELPPQVTVDEGESLPEPVWPEEASAADDESELRDSAEEESEPKAEPACKEKETKEGDKSDSACKEKKKDGAKDKDKDKDASPWPAFWLKVPPVRPLPRLGNFLILPTGPGYYSLWDWLSEDYREKPPAYPYSRVSIQPPPFFDFSFAYLDRSSNQEHDFFDPIKRIHLGDCWLLSTGGEFRWRYNHEFDSRLSGITNDYDLIRTRVYGDAWYRDDARVFVEFLDAHGFGLDLDPLAIDNDPADFLNLFFDVKAGCVNGQPVWARVGRQEILYGSQRLISTLDWANVRRLFQGAKAFWQSDDLAIDGFWVRPVIPNVDGLDWMDNSQNFSGLWLTVAPKKKRSLDLYYLNLDQSNPVATGQYGHVGGFNNSTLGARYWGTCSDNRLLFDFEAMHQFGAYANQAISASACTTGLGYCQTCNCWLPFAWVLYDYASGDWHPNATNIHGTFNQLFPFGHYYLGYTDLVARQNIHDLNFALGCFPTKWITLHSQFHIFQLDSPFDALYGAGGQPLRRDPTGQAGRDVGQELDVFFNLHLDKHSDLMLQYGHLFAGPFIERTGNPESPDVFFVQYSFRW